MRTSRLRALAQGHVEKPPSRFRTVRQWAAAEGYSESRMGHIMSRLLSAGRVELRHYRIRSGLGVRRVPHYALRVLNKPSKKL